MLKRLIKTCVDNVFALRRRSQPERPRRILVIMCNYIGDTFWAMQAIPFLKAKWPDAEIWAGVKPHSKPLLFGLVPDERVIALRNVLSDRTRESFSFKGFVEELKSVRAKHFDIALDLTFNRFSAIFAGLSGAGFTAGCDSADEFSGLYDLQIPYSPNDGRHLALRPHTVASILTGAAPDSAPRIPFPPIPRLKPEDVRAKLGIPASAKIALLLPGAGWESKRWPAENFAKVALKLEEKGFVPVVSDAPSGKALCEKIVSGLRSGIALNGPLDEAIALMPLTSLAVSNDSGAAHLAAAFGTRVVSICCSTNPGYVAPLGTNVRVLTSACEFSPTGLAHHCAIYPKTSCDKPQWMSVSVENVIDAALS